MNRLHLGIGLLAVLLAVGIALSCVFHHIFAPLSQTLEDAGNHALSGDWAQAQTLSQQAYENWLRSRDLTAAAADHAPLEQMEQLFSNLQVYRALGLRGEFAAICAQLAQMAKAMEESQAVRWWSLL